MNDKAVGWTWVAAATCITPIAAEIHGLVFTPSAATASVSIYDGRDNSGRLLLSVLLTTADTLVVPFPRPLHCDNGIYVHTPTNLTGILVQWAPTPKGKV